MSATRRTGGPSRWRGLDRWLPLVLVPVSLLAHPVAALPLRTYYFRDFGMAFFPLRLFAARELHEGRLPAWNPFIFEGTFQLPSLYPPDLLHVLWPSPVFVSWLLTLHLPLAALGAYWLARELGTSRAGAFVSGVVFALGGFALSCLNLYVFLQALALAPFVVGWLRRAAARGGRSVPVAAAVVAVALSTLAVEFVGQAVVLGWALGLAARPARPALSSLATATVLGTALGAVPIVLVLGPLPETLRGAGFTPEVFLANAVHPATLVQAVLPNAFGVLRAPAEAWWGGRFFSHGLPYILSLYIGPLALALAALGLSRVEWRTRLALLVLLGLGVWYALGEWGGLAPLVQGLPFASALRFPAKALLGPHLVVAILAGVGASRLSLDRRAWPWLAGLVATAAAVGLAVGGVVALGRPGLVEWSGVVAEYWPNVAAVVVRDAAVLAVIALVSGGLAWAVRRGHLSTGRALALLAGLLAADLARAGAGLNPQVHASYYDPLPEIAELRLDELDAGRVFSYGLEHSPAFRDFLSRGGRALTLAGSYLNRQILAPYANVIDRVEAAEANDLTAFVPRPRELGPDSYAPERAGELLPWLRNAAVTRVLSLDPLGHPDLVPLREVPAGPPGLRIHVYGVSRPWPRAAVACRVVLATSREASLARPYVEGYEPLREVALEEADGELALDEELEATCQGGTARRVAAVAGEERFSAESDASGYLVVRTSYARGWSARVDGLKATVRRANGKHIAVPVPAGRHEVVLRYEPPFLWIGIATMAVALVLLGLLWWQGGGATRA